MYDWLDAALSEAHSAASNFNARLEVILNAATSRENIDSVEAALQISLPPSIRAFAAVHDGLRLNVTAQFTFFLEIYSVSQMLANTNELREFWDGEEPWASYVAIGTYGDGSDFCAFDSKHDVGNGEKAIIDVFHEEPNLWRDKIIASSLEELLRRALDAMIDRREYPFYWNPSKM